GFVIAHAQRPAVEAGFFDQHPFGDTGRATGLGCVTAVVRRVIGQGQIAGGRVDRELERVAEAHGIDFRQRLVLGVLRFGEHVSLGDRVRASHTRLGVGRNLLQRCDPQDLPAQIVGVRGGGPGVVEGSFPLGQWRVAAGGLRVWVDVVADTQLQVAVLIDLDHTAGVSRLIGQTACRHLEDDTFSGGVDRAGLGIHGEAGDLVVEVRRVGVVLTGRRVVDVQVPVLQEVRVQSDTQQTVLTTGVNLQLQGSVRGERLRVVDLDLAADQFGEEDPAVLGNVHSKGCGGVLVQGDALVLAPVRATTVPVHETGGPLHSAQDVLDE